METADFSFVPLRVTSSEPMDRESFESEQVDIDTPEPGATDLELLARAFEKEEPKLGGLVAAGCPLQFFQWYLSCDKPSRHKIGTICMQYAGLDASRISLERVSEFARSTPATRNAALAMKTVKMCPFFTFSAFHNYMVHQPDVKIVPVPIVSDNNSDSGSQSARLRIAYIRGSVPLEIPFGASPAMLGRSLESVNNVLKEMFSDKDLKPQLVRVSESLIAAATHLLLVAKFKVEENGQLSYEFLPIPTWRPKWKKAEEKIPSDLVAYYQDFWSVNLSKLRRNFFLEMMDAVNYLIFELVDRKVTKKLEDKFHLPGYSAIQGEVETELQKRMAEPDEKSLVAEISQANHALARSRGFRGKCPALDLATHDMFEIREVGPAAFASSKMGFARLISLIDEDLVRKQVKVVGAYDNMFEGKISTWFNMLKHVQRPYIAQLRADFLGKAQAPVHKADGEDPSYSSAVDLDQAEQPFRITPNAFVWFPEFEDPPADKSYLDLHADRYARLLDDCQKLRPRYVYVPLHLSFLNLSHPLGQMVAFSKSADLKPTWTRGHNAELWFCLEFDEVIPTRPDPEKVTVFNAYQVLAARRLCVFNYVRDYLISAGEVYSYLGYRASPSLLLSIMKTYCFSKEVVQSQKVVASSLAVLPAPSKPVSVGRVRELFPDMHISNDNNDRSGRSFRPPTDAKPKRGREARSPSVDSVGSGGSKGSQDVSVNGKSWSAHMEELDSVPAPEEPPAPLVNRAEERRRQTRQSGAAAPVVEKGTNKPRAPPRKTQKKAK